MLNEPIIEIRHIAKRYEIGIDKTYKTLRDSIVSAVIRPIQTIRGFQKPDNFFWALNNVTFDVNNGDVIGLVGRNGAGKSTLLKILSRITYPTSGSVLMRGRVGSLLEIGTGFDGELSGRENIYFNGAILGMKHQEIDAKFDEIVKFAGIEKFLDTPYKRYSSGMGIRIAFSVAAHLDPEILIVDEVLAVGDIEFQQKCLGKMNEVAENGRTILFVSHNLGAIKSLCERGILLNEGRLILDSDIDTTIAKYLEVFEKTQTGFATRNHFDEKRDLLISTEILDSGMHRQVNFAFDDSINIRLETNSKVNGKFSVEFRIKNSRKEYVGYGSSLIHGDGNGTYVPGENILINIPHVKLVQDTYTIEFDCRTSQISRMDAWWECIQFNITSCTPHNSPFSIKQSDDWGSVIFDDVIFNKE